MKKAILDFRNHDIGLKILYPEADCYTFSNEFNREMSYKKYNFTSFFIEKYEEVGNYITPEKYDILFIVCPIYETYRNGIYYTERVEQMKNHLFDMMNLYEFKKVFIFDNKDYDYDPNTYFDVSNWKTKQENILFFKRNYDKNKVYKDNVVTFPYIMFGDKSLIEKLDTELVSEEQYFNINKKDRLYFTGCVFNHVDYHEQIQVNRIAMYYQLVDIIYNPCEIDHPIPYDDYISIMRDSKFCLDLLGVGNPNKRTFEILMSGSLMMGQYNNLKWPWDDSFAEETKFKTSQELREKIHLLRNNDELYMKCLRKQYEIVKKYFTIEWVKDYINKFIT